MRLAELIVAAVAVYAAAGILFAVPFVAVGATRIDPRARAAGWAFRIILIPGSVALWPFLLRRWIGEAGAR